VELEELRQRLMEEQKRWIAQLKADTGTDPP
jgi:hypothetical protein